MRNFPPLIRHESFWADALNMFLRGKVWRKQAGCQRPHDPKPYEHYVVMTSDGSWADDGWALNPDPGYCQNIKCYEEKP